MSERTHEARAPEADRTPAEQATPTGPGLLDLQRKAGNQATVAAIQRKGGGDVNLPSALRSGIESLSGMSLDAPRVHYGSALPARLGAQAYARGSDIHLAPGAEKHLSHEAWHVVQQGSKSADALEDEGSELEGEADTAASAIVAPGGEAAETETEE